MTTNKPILSKYKKISNDNLWCGLATCIGSMLETTPCNQPSFLPHTISNCIRLPKSGNNQSNMNERARNLKLSKRANISNVKKSKLSDKLEI